MEEYDEFLNARPLQLPLFNFKPLCVIMMNQVVMVEIYGDDNVNMHIADECPHEIDVINQLLHFTYERGHIHIGDQHIP